MERLDNQPFHAYLMTTILRVWLVSEDVPVDVAGEPNTVVQVRPTALVTGAPVSKVHSAIQFVS